MFEIPLDIFKSLALEIAELYNLVSDSKEFNISNIEFNCRLVDTNGYRLESWALIRPKDKSEYVCWVNLYGSPIEALQKLKDDLLSKLKEKSPENFKKQIFKLN